MEDNLKILKWKSQEQLCLPYSNFSCKLQRPNQSLITVKIKRYSTKEDFKNIQRGVSRQPRYILEYIGGNGIN